MTLANLWHYRRLPAARPRAATEALPKVSVLIPARNEEDAIAHSVRAVLASADGVEVEVVVMDDDSTDRTAEVVKELAQNDPRVRLVRSHGPPAGWCGKQHACWQLAQHASHDVLVWIDADVRLEGDALTRLVRFIDDGDAALVSGFPRQDTGTWLEKLIVPLIPVVLIGYLPMWRMRGSTHPSYGAGCGQWFAARRGPYMQVGGHSAIRASMHDGVTLPRVFRQQGFMTDLFDATDTAVCRMYRSAGQVWKGFAKNATEGLASPKAIGVWTVLLGGGFVLPWVLLAMWGVGRVGPMSTAAVAALVGACVLSAGHSVLVAGRFRQDVSSAVFRPAGVLAMLAVQWYALGRKVAGRPSAWRGRVVSEVTPPAAP